MAEEHRCQAPKLCNNNCGFFGSPATRDLCSKCYRDLQLKEQQSSSAKLALNQTLTSAATATTTMSSSFPDTSSLNIKSPSSELNQPSADVADKAQTSAAAEAAPASAPSPSQPSRCMTCRKRVGLAGFKCRCGMVFCGTHRYPEQHGCDFDFKGMGKEQIAKANPVVKGEKLQKI